MELTVLNNSCLSNQVTTNFACEWSKDGRIFVVTDATVYVLKFTPCMTNIDNYFTFEKSEIYVGEYYPAEQSGINMDDVLNHLSKENLYRAILNANLTPKIAGANPAILRPVAASWSPTTLYKNASFLAVLSSAGSVEIYLQKKTKWFCLTNIIPYWIEQLRPSWNYVNSEQNFDTQYILHEERVLHYMATCACWSVSYKDNISDYCYIVLGHASGKISVWKINSIDTDTDNLIPVYIYSCDTGMKKITALYWCAVNGNSAWLVFGNIDGYIKCIPIINVHFGEFFTGDIIDIYTEKDIRVSHITSIKFENNEYIISIKGCHIIISRLDENRKLIFSKHVNIGNIGISGIQPMKPGCFMVLTTTGILKAVKLVKNEDTIDYKIIQIKSDVKLTYHCARGLIKSPHGTLWGLLMYPCKIIDHLIVRQPTQITFCTNTKLNPGAILKTNSTMSMTNAWECLEIIRCLSAKNNSLACLWLVRCSKYDDLPLYELRIFMWVSTSCQAFIHRKLKCRKLKSFVASPDILRKIIFFKFYLQRLKYLLEKYEKNLATSFQMDSMYLLRDHVVNFGKDELFEQYLSSKSTEELHAVVERMKDIEFEIPKCFFCGDDLTSQPCKSKHPDQRCEISCVQFVDEGARWECHLCTLCGCSHLEEDYLFCPLCDVPLTSFV